MSSWFDEDFFQTGEFRKQMEKAMARAFKDMPKLALERMPTTDVEEKGGQVIVRLDMPGVDKKDIDLLATEDTIEVKAERKEFAQEEKKNFFRRERSYRSYSRSLSLPAKINPNSIKADYSNGVLTLTAEKKGAKAEKKVKVKL